MLDGLSIGHLAVTGRTVELSFVHEYYQHDALYVLWYYIQCCRMHVLAKVPFLAYIFYFFLKLHF